MKKQLTVIATVVMLIFSISAFSRARSMDGTYRCKGYDPFEKSPYEGLLQVKKTGLTYSLTSDYGKNSIYHAIGIYDEPHHIMSAAFTNPNKPEEAGVALLRVQKDGVLTSQWTYIQKIIIGKSRCVKIG